MKTLVDTNIVSRLAQPPHPQHRITLQALDALKATGVDICIVPQVIYEFWTVCTRPPGDNGLGLSVTDARAEQARALALFPLLPDNPAVFAEWQRLVVQYEVKGKNAHDARLVAAMAVHGVDSILTFNLPDFARYSDIKVLDPAAYAPGGPA